PASRHYNPPSLIDWIAKNVYVQRRPCPREIVKQMIEQAFVYPKIARRDFLTRAGIALGGAAAAGMGASFAAQHPSWLVPVAAGDVRVGRLKRLRSAHIAERVFGQLDWGAVRAASMHSASASILNDERMYFVPIATRDATSSLLVLSEPSTTSREQRGLAAA